MLENQLLYNFLEQNLQTGEFMEMYISWHDHINYKFDAPNSECFMNMNDLLTMPIPVKPLMVDVRQKITITKTALASPSRG
jgi:hypothetical protein